jgi:hypothetical protein
MFHSRLFPAERDKGEKKKRLLPADHASSFAKCVEEREKKREVSLHEPAVLQETQFDFLLADVSV